jgi:3-hydroxyisobutyrate dehydrogenase
MKQKILFIGLGVMGFHMSGHLSSHYQTYVYNRSKDKTKNWLNTFKGHEIHEIDDIDDSFDAIITCIGNDQDLQDIYLSERGLINQCSSKTLLIDHTTSSADIARRISKNASVKDISFIDAPVSGGEQGAINGQLTIMCGGPKVNFLRAQEIMQHYARASSLLGENGAGQLTKMANQMAVAGIVQGLAEAIHFSEQAGLDCTQVIDVISKGAAQSWQMENRSSTMIEGQYNHGFAVDLMRKDLGICLAEARLLGAKLPITALIDQFYGDVQDMGGNRWDTSSLLERLRKK